MKGCRQGTRRLGATPRNAQLKPMRCIRGIIPGVGAAFFGNFARLRGICCRRLPERKVCSVKIILIRTPGILSPLLRRLFGIRRQKPGR